MITYANFYAVNGAGEKITPMFDSYNECFTYCAEHDINYDEIVSTND